MSENDETKLPRRGDEVPFDGDLSDMLNKAASEGVIVIFGADGMTVDEIMHAIMHPQHSKNRLMIIGDAPHTVPGDASALN